MKKIDLKKLKTYEIPSSTDKNKTYIVREMAEGGLRCTCPGFVYREDCKHVKKVQRIQAKSRR